MKNYLIYNLSGELDDMSHLFPNERLGRIAAIVRAQGGKATVIDRANLDDLIEFGSAYMENLGGLQFHASNEFYESRLGSETARLLDAGAEVVFLNLWHGTGFKFSIDLARALKRTAPALRIYGVGQKVDWFKEHILELADNGLDGLITGLGYDAVTHAVRCGSLDHSSNSVVSTPQGLVVNRTRALNVDAFPAAVYDQSIYTTIGGKIPVYSLVLSNQACPNRCVFCIRPQNYGRRNIRRSTDSVLNELSCLHDRHGVRHVRIEDSTPPARALTELAQAVLGSRLRGKLKFSGFSRLDTNSSEDFALLRDAGFEALFFGAETLDDGSLRRLRKGITYAQTAATLRAAHAAGIHTVVSFIFPLPGETRRTMTTTMDRLAQISAWVDSLLVLPAGVYPHTDWGENPQRHGIVLEPNYVERFITYPLKYLLPFKYWPPAPFRYSVLGKSTEEVDSRCILDLYEEFLGHVRANLGIPAIPDYYYLLADLLGCDARSATSQLIQFMVQRDYAAIRELFRPCMGGRRACPSRPAAAPACDLRRQT